MVEVKGKVRVVVTQSARGVYRQKDTRPGIAINSRIAILLVDENK
jgi:hypothetical protein